MHPKKIRFSIILILLKVFLNQVVAQNFVRVYSNDCTQFGAISLPASFNDFNNDSLPDLFIGKINTLDNLFYLNSNGTLKAPINSFNKILKTVLAVTCADYDNDGFRDLFLALRDDKFLLLKTGVNGLTSIVNNPLTTTSAIGESASWVDYDNDGLVDLFITVGNANDNLLFKNLNYGNFGSIDTTYITSKNFGYATHAAWCDFDDDGWQDVFIANQEENCRFFVNDGNGNFTQLVSAPFNNYQVANSANWADYDNDGDMDLFVLGGVNFNPAKIVVYENLGNRNFVINNFTGLSDSTVVSTGSSWGDYNNDGYIDFFVAQSSRFSTDNSLIFFQNNGNKTFSKATNIVTGEIVEARAVVNADMDNDGDLDVFVSQENYKNDMIFENKTTNKSWLKVRLEGLASNKSAIGARVRVFCTINGKKQILTRDIAGQTGWYSQNDLTVHFGLGNTTCADSVIIYWPSGKQCVYKNLPANQFYFINENCNNITPSATNFSLGNDTTVCYGNELLLSTGEPLTVWNNSQTGSSLVVKESGTYIATVSGTCITSFSDTIQIDFKDCICSLNMPNAFSPNGDNVNDLYGPVYDCPVSDFSMTVFNRWGEKVFETNNIEQMWDGTFMGKEQPIGVFLYKVNYKDSWKNEKKLITGKITLIR